MENKKVERSVGGHEMTDEQKLRVLNALMRFQEAVYAADSVEDIPWFYSKRTKYVLKAAVDHILKDHKPIITALWGEGGTKMDEATMAREEYAKEKATLEYWKTPDITTLVRAYKRGSFTDEMLEAFRKEEVQNGGE